MVDKESLPPSRISTSSTKDAAAEKKVPPMEEMSTMPQFHDVLLGRGTGQNEYIGNRRFRSFVETRKDEYLGTRSNKEKNRIAEEILDHICAQGGRFLRLSDEYVRRDGCIVVEDGIWYVAPDDVALEKCKQMLREKRSKWEATRQAGNTIEHIRGRTELIEPASLDEVRVDNAEDVPYSVLSRVASREVASSLPSPSTYAPLLPSMLQETTVPHNFGPNVQLFHPAPFLLHPSYLSQSYMNIHGMTAPPATYSQAGRLPEIYYGDHLADETLRQAYGAEAMTSSQSPGPLL